METFLGSLYTQLPIFVLLGIILLSLITLSKGADILVDEAVILSKKMGIPPIIIGATVVSLGTTLPETSVSVMAALAGNPDLALGNAVGSIICDTGLILGIAIIISPPILQKKQINFHGWFQLAMGILLILVSIPYKHLNNMTTIGGHITQSTGIIFLIILVFYILLSIYKAQKENGSVTIDDSNLSDTNKLTTLIKLALGIALVILSSKILIPAVQETALRLNIPQSIIAATLVAFGTSLPELMTAITAARKGQSELAVGNIIGADILNVLFVTGAATAVTPGGLAVPPQFFIILFPTMLFVLLVFRFGTILYNYHLKRSLGLILLGTYIIISLLSYSDKLI